MSTLVSLGLFPFFLIAAFEDILYVYIYIAAVLAALFGMVMSLFSRPGIRGVVFLASSLCLAWCWLVVGFLVAYTVEAVD